MVDGGKGARAQGPKLDLRLNQPCRRFITNTKVIIMASKKKKAKKKSK